MVCMTADDQPQTTDGGPSGEPTGDYSCEVVVEVVSSRSSRRPTESRLTRLRKRVRGGRTAQREEFDHIMDAARQAAATDPRSLPSLINLFGRAAQSRAFTEVLRYEQDAATCDYMPEEVLFAPYTPLTADGQCFEDLRREVEAPWRVRLGIDVLLPWPWSRERLLTSLSKLRPGGDWGDWRQDDNHRVELWLPVGVGWVFGGNHSITAGIINAAGEITPEV